jgi:hypothetical protein
MNEHSRKARVNITLSLTSAQANVLGLLAVGGAMASENPPIERAMWVRIHDALTEASLDAERENVARAARTKPCRHCGRVLLHSARGLQMAPKHCCPHGK